MGKGRGRAGGPAGRAGGPANRADAPVGRRAGGPDGRAVWPDGRYSGWRPEDLTGGHGRANMQAGSLPRCVQAGCNFLGHKVARHGLSHS